MTLKRIEKYFTILKNNIVRCNLCPHECIIVNNLYGLCNTRTNIDGKLYSIVYGYPCSIQIDPIEKKPLYHYYPGEKILSIGTTGCNLFCKGCQNFEISRARVEKQQQYYTPEDIVDIALKNDIKLIAYTYNEPTIFFEYMIDIAKIARKNKIKNVIVTNGFINPEPLKELYKYIDAANIDIKGIEPKFYKEYCKADLIPVLNTIKLMHKKKIWIELTNLIIPTLNDSSEEITHLCKWIVDNIGTEVPLHFSKFYPYYNASNIKPTDAKTIYNAKDIAIKSGIKYVYTGNLGVIDNTYCYNCKKLIIDRYDNSRCFFSKEKTTLKKIEKKSINRCINCSSTIPGEFYNTK